MILIIDDEKNIRRTLGLVVDGEGYACETAGSGEEGLTLLRQSGADVVFLDVQLPGMNGLDTLRALKSADPHVEVIMISGHASLTDAVEATRLGAFDFLEKPLDRDRVLITLRNALSRRHLHLRVEALGDDKDPWGMIGDAPAMRTLKREIEKVAPTKGRVLVTGESGTGKELVARAIHNLSPRADKTFVKVNCAAIPSELIESELFGHEKGSFSGALNRKRGKFELAHGGTLFLDEIGDMDLAAQAKVLRTLQTGEVYRVGSEQPFQVDVRVIAATNKDLAEAIKDGKFREDLYFRLNVVPLRTPPLRERREDIALMAEAFVREFCDENGMRRKGLAVEVVEALGRYRWPGNVRELKNLCERLVIMGGDPIALSDVPDHIAPRQDELSLAPRVEPGSMPLREFGELAERHYVEATLRAFGWNVTRAAKALGIERTNLHKKLKALGIERDGDERDEPDA
jgi:two-component system nitrogen regulation response regulator NtrX